MKKVLLLLLLLVIPAGVFAGTLTIQESLINLATSRDRYFVSHNIIAKSSTTTIQRFEGEGTKKQTKIDDYFNVSIKNKKGVIVRSYQISAPYNKKSYPLIEKGNFPESFVGIVNMSPSSRYLYFQTNQFETSNGYLMRISDGKIMHKFAGIVARVTRTPDRQRLLVGGQQGMGSNPVLMISDYGDITNYTTIEIDGSVRSMIADNKKVSIYIIRSSVNTQTDDGLPADDHFIETYDLANGKLLSSKKIPTP